MLLDRISFVPIEGTHQAAELFASYLVGVPNELLCVAFLDEHVRLLNVTLCPPGKEGSVCVPLRAIVREALQVDARALILAHNHPRGASVPSASDKRVTRRISEVLRELDIRLLDHLLFAGETVTSFRALSLL